MGLPGKFPLKDQDEIVSLPDWRERLLGDPALSTEQKRSYLGAVLWLIYMFADGLRGGQGRIIFPPWVWTASA